MHRADRPGVEQRLRQPVDRVAPVVLGHGQPAAGPVRRIDERGALGDGQRDRFLDHHVQAVFQRRDPDRRVQVGRGRDDDRVEFGPVEHRFERAEHLGPVPERFLREIGGAFGACRENIAGGDEIPRAVADPSQFLQATDMAATHAAAADQSQSQHE